MIELADVFRRFAADYLAAHGASMPVSHRRAIEDILNCRTAALGGNVAVLAVLHTWTQQLHFHPHVHCLVSGGGISEDGSTWHPARRQFLLPIKALATLVRGKFRALLRQKCPDLVIPDAVWHTPWILHVSTWGN